MNKTRSRIEGPWRCIAAIACCWLTIGCAATTGGVDPNMPPPIPEGMGRLHLEAGGIPQLNFYIVDQETDEEVYSDSPLAAASSPRAYQTGVERNRLTVDLAPGTYTVVVSTHIDDIVEVRDVEIVMGEDRYATIPIGRFQIRFLGSEGTPQQVPFVILDYRARTLLGKGMTSLEVRHFLLPTGRTYKIRIENAPSGLDVIRPVEVRFGGVAQLTIGEPASTEPDQPPGRLQ